MRSKGLLEGSSSDRVVFAFKGNGCTCLYFNSVLCCTALKPSAAACTSLFLWPKRQRDIQTPRWTLTTNCRTGVLTQGWWPFSGKLFSLALTHTHARTHARTFNNLLTSTWGQWWQIECNLQLWSPTGLLSVRKSTFYLIICWVRRVTIINNTREIDWLSIAMD